MLIFGARNGQPDRHGKKDEATARGRTQEGEGGEQAPEGGFGAGEAALTRVRHDDRRSREELQHPDKKKSWHQTVDLLRTAEAGASLATLCGLFGYSRQSYYKYGGDDFKPLALEPILVERVKRYREENPRLGSVKLWLMLKKQLDETGCFPGRDAFIEMLRRNGLMVRIRRRHHYVTTDSNHNLRKYPNLIKGLVVTEPNRVWVSDITYIETKEGVLYLSLVTDLYSHKIVGWAIGPTLIHHSDRGCQYCSADYVDELRERKIQISMTQSGDPLENPVAERANGILKTECLYHMELLSEKQ